eukprot:780655_1
MIYDRPPQPPYCAESEAIMAMRRCKHQRACVLLDKADKVEDSVLRKRVQDGNVIFKKLLLDSSADNGDYIAECSWDLDGLSEEFRDLTSAKAQHFCADHTPFLECINGEGNFRGGPGERPGRLEERPGGYHMNADQVSAPAADGTEKKEGWRVETGCGRTQKGDFRHPCGDFGDLPGGRIRNRVIG